MFFPSTMGRAHTPCTTVGSHCLQQGEVTVVIVSVLVHRSYLRLHNESVSSIKYSARLYSVGNTISPKLIQRKKKLDTGKKKAKVYSVWGKSTLVSPPWEPLQITRPTQVKKRG